MYGDEDETKWIRSEVVGRRLVEAKAEAAKAARLELLRSFDEYLSGASAGFGQAVGVAFEEELQEHEARIGSVQDELQEQEALVQERKVNIQVLEAQIECLREDRDELTRANSRDRKVYLRRRRREHAATVSVTSLLSAASAMVVILAVLFLAL